MKRVNFKIQCSDHIVPVKGYYVGKYESFELVCHRDIKDEKQWCVSELFSGLSVSRSFHYDKTRQSAIEEAEFVIRQLDKKQISKAHEKMRNEAINNIEIIK